MKGRKNRATGGVNEAEKDLRDNPAERNNAAKVFGEAKARKSGGRSMKMVGKVSGEACNPYAGRTARKSGGRATSDANPFTSARTGTAPAGRKLDMEMD